MCQNAKELLHFQVQTAIWAGVFCICGCWNLERARRPITSSEDVYRHSFGYLGYSWGTIMFSNRAKRWLFGGVGQPNSSGLLLVFPGSFPGQTVSNRFGNSESSFSYRRYCKFSWNRANQPRGIAISKMEFLERLNKTTFTVAQQSTRNAYFCLVLQ